MNLKAYLFEEDRGVSPVIGVILMVAITVILAAVIATFVMNMGPNQNTPANANRKWSYDGSSVTLTHNGGEAATVSEYAVTTKGGSTEVALDTLYSSGDKMTASDSTVVAGGSTSISVSSSTTMQLIWKDPDSDQTQIVEEWDVTQ